MKNKTFSIQIKKKIIYFLFNNVKLTTKLNFSQIDQQNTPPYIMDFDSNTVEGNYVNSCFKFNYVDINTYLK